MPTAARRRQCYGFDPSVVGVLRVSGDGDLVLDAPPDDELGALEVAGVDLVDLDRQAQRLGEHEVDMSYRRRLRHTAPANPLAVVSSEFAGTRHHLLEPFAASVSDKGQAQATRFNTWLTDRLSEHNKIFKLSRLCSEEQRLRNRGNGNGGGGGADVGDGTGLPKKPKKPKGPKKGDKGGGKGDEANTDD